MDKINCLKCSQMAVWLYVPGKGDKYYCEEHVPRGCACNFILKPGINLEIDLPTGITKNPPEDWTEAKDELGRLLPCVEYDWCEEGFNNKEIL